MSRADEQWRPCPPFPGYEVSSKGRVKHKRKLVKPALYRRQLCVRLKQEPKRRIRVAYMVAEAFIESTDLADYETRLRIHFRDGDPLNCRASNLLIIPRRHSSTADLERARLLIEGGVSSNMMRHLTGVHYDRLRRYRWQKEKAEQLE